MPGKSLENMHVAVLAVGKERRGCLEGGRLHFGGAARHGCR